MKINFILKNYKNFKNFNLLNNETVNLTKIIKNTDSIKKGNKILLKYENMIIKSEINDIIIDMTHEEPIYNVYCEMIYIEKEENNE